MAADTNSFGWNGPAARLPAELWVMIAANLDLDTFSGLTRASRGFHYLLAGELIPHHVKGAKTKVDLVARISEVFVHAARIDSTRILDQLRTNYRRVVDPAGFLAPAPGQTTFLDFALAADAPRVVRHLVRTGCDIDLVALQQPPGIKQLSLTLAGCHGGRSWMAAADSALRAAIHHAMPRTVRFLLARGASANGMADGQGEPALHAALQRREMPGLVTLLVSLLNDRADCLWQHRVGQTVAALLDFGAAPDTRTPPAARLHTCSRLCWRFTACHYGWETPLHLAAAAGFAEAIPPLLAKHPAGFHAPDAGGYTALYRALVKDRLDAALALLNDPCAPPNPPILVITAIPPHDGNGTTTALHAASRLALFPVVHALLQRGADPNAIDPATGR
ncbi:ankyrin repeat-containing domain protein, partial [Chaetomium fimeti]